MDANKAPLRLAMSWQLLVWWTLGMLLPAAIVAMPLTTSLSALLDHVVGSDQLARRFDFIAFSDVVTQLHPQALKGATTLAVLTALLLAPLMAGLATAAWRSDEVRLFPLLRDAVGEYPRMFRLGFVALIPYAIAGGFAAGFLAIGSHHAEKSVTATAAESLGRVMTILAAIFLIAAQLTVEAARAQFAADGALRSALRAWGRGLKLVAARPGAVLVRYLVPTLLSLGLAALLLALRIRLAGPWTVVTFLLTQLGVAAIGWGRAGRIMSLATLVRQQGGARGA
jgi:hypothetical protein